MITDAWIAEFNAESDAWIAERNAWEEAERTNSAIDFFTKVRQFQEARPDPIPWVPDVDPLARTSSERAISSAWDLIEYLRESQGQQVEERRAACFAHLDRLPSVEGIPRPYLQLLRDEAQDALDYALEAWAHSMRER